MSQCLFYASWDILCNPLIWYVPSSLYSIIMFYKQGCIDTVFEIMLENMYMHILSCHEKTEVHIAHVSTDMHP